VLACSNFDGASFEREGEDAVDAVDDLLAGVVTVRDGHLRSGWPTSDGITTLIHVNANLV